MSKGRTDLNEIPMHKRGVGVWRSRTGKLLSASSGLQPHEVEFFRDIVRYYDETGKADRFIVYDNEAGGKRAEASPDFIIKRMSREGEEGYKPPYKKEEEQNNAPAPGDAI